jgi:hypothetical protein
VFSLTPTCHFLLLGCSYLTPNNKENILSNVNGALEKARGEAQELHKQISSNLGKDQAKVRANAQTLSSQAQELSRSVKALAGSQQADAKQRLNDAASVLEGLAGDAKSLASASQAELKAKNEAALHRARAAALKLSQALAAQRASSQLIHS